MTKLNMPSEPDYKVLSAFGEKENEGPIGLVALWRVLRSNKLTLLLPALLFAAIASFAALRGSDSYSAEAQLILTRDNLDIIALDSSDRETVDSAVVVHAVNILNSRALATQVIEELGLAEDPEINPYIGVETIVEQPGLIRRMLYGLGLSQPASTDATSPREVEQDYLLGWLLSTYSAAAIPNSNVIVVAATTQDPELSADIANKLVEAFLDFGLEASRQEAEQAIEALSARVQSLRMQVQADQSALQDARANIQVNDPAALQALSSELAELNTRAAEVTGEIEALGAVRDALDALAGEAPEVIAERLTTDARFAGITRSALSTAPTAETARSGLDAVRASVTASLATQEQRRDALEAGSDRLASRLRSSNENTLTLSRLEVELETTTAVYSSALARLKELVMESGLRNQGGRFLARAAPPVKADSQGRRRFVAIAAVLGLLVGAAVVLIREASNERIRSLSDMPAAARAYARVEIPRLKSRMRFARPLRNGRFLAGKDNAFSEAVRICRRLILEQAEPGQPLTINVISALPREGKSTLCGALASSFVLVGKRTLIIDADLRARGLTSSIEPNLPAVGLQQAITDHPIGALQYVQHSSELGFDYLPAGEDLRNPADLLEMKHFKSLVNELKERYDVVLIDTPPVLLFPEARSVAEVANHTLLVTGYNQTPTSALNEVFTLLPKKAMSRLTLVLAKVPYSAGARFGAPERKSSY
ncbi:tyrosine-protein kinase domain-containing protein [Salipiger sp. PrR002]|uniref:GumC family protein n=1 Tax=Salipiger sp. PrR002 TaxID=2706489 RepID=UPI0013B85E0F|nr:tyrosine-protein kinase domain-containing protein [Salipiger sp. PrR002]NDW00444.1 AAA family ATPase [Salipiger sp. PrR002]NDW56402.1 AAA family ATPase [Salipiger sp. PrR004]